MKRLLLSVCLIGIAFSGNTHAPLNTDRAVPAAAEPLGGGRAESIVPKNPMIQRVSLRSSESAGILQEPLPEASVKEIFAPALPQVSEAKDQDGAEDADDEGLWVVVIRGAWMHSGPSVSAPIVGHRSPGTDLHLIGQQQGWYEVLDPATDERGWILARYYLEPTDRPGRKRVAVQEPQAPVTAAPAAAEPPKAVRRVMQQPQFLAPPQVQAEKTQPAPRHRDESVANLLRQALRY
jgi:hypothetical protein